MPKLFNQFDVVQINNSTLDDDWNKIKKTATNLTTWGFDLLKNNLSNVVKTIFIEKDYICKDHRNLYSNFYSKKFQESSSYCNRLHFFSKNNMSLNDIVFNTQEYNDDYIGFSIIRPLKKRCIGRTIIDPLKINHPSYPNLYCLRTPYQSYISGNRLIVKGYPYISQDSDVNVCAHATLWGVCRYLSERYTIYNEMYPFDLVNLTLPYHGRTFPYRGMNYSDYCKILSDFGCYPIVLKLKERSEDKEHIKEEFMDLCTYVESGFPVLASFVGHVIAIIGHTLDYSKSFTIENNIIDSSQFYKQFIVVDDNFFPYQLLGEEGDSQNYANLPGQNFQFNIKSIFTAVCPLPEKAFLTATKIRKYALTFFDKYKKELKKIGKDPWVSRLFLTTSKAFKEYKIKIVDNRNKEIIFSALVAQLNLPHFIWVMEISTIELYKKNECISELIMDSTAGSSEEAAIYLRIGNDFISNDQIIPFKDALNSFPQYKHNLGG